MEFLKHNKDVSACSPIINMCICEVQCYCSPYVDIRNAETWEEHYFSLQNLDNVLPSAPVILNDTVAVNININLMLLSYK